MDVVERIEPVHLVRVHVQDVEDPDKFLENFLEFVTSQGAVANGVFKSFHDPNHGTYERTQFIINNGKLDKEL